MAGQLPTRRAFRPDGQYYRTSRRLGLGRRGGGGGRAGRAEGLGLAAVLVLVAVLGFWWGHHGGVVAGVFGYGVMALATIGAIGVLVRR